MRRPQILIVEDDHDSRVALRETLEQEGYVVFTAANGEQGFSLLEQLPGLDVILLDQNMPYADGERFLRLRNGRREFREIPVLLASAVPDRLSAFGASGFLAKPYDVPVLLQTLARLCRRRIAS